MSTSNGVHHDTDEAIDLLYSWMPGLTPAPQPLPEAAFSITLKGKLDGQEALLTARGQTATEFKRNLEAIRGLLDAPQAPQAPVPTTGQEKGWCPIHAVQMKLQQKGEQSWYSHWLESGKFCKGR